MPDDLHQRTGTSAEHEQVAAMGIALQVLLHEQRQPLHPLPHVGVAHRDPNPRARRDHRSAISTADAKAGDAEAAMLTRPLPGSSTTIATKGDGAPPGSLVSTASAKPGPGNAEGAG
jgi:hypothetical protein